MRYAVLAIALAACGPSASTEPKCTATFAGNFADYSEGACPSAKQDFEFTADAPSVSARLTGKIALGPGLVPTTFTSQSATGAWSALMTREPGCVYSAGRDVVPQGNFRLVLSSIAPAHGTLELTQYVHALPGADCGRGDVQTVTLAF